VSAVHKAALEGAVHMDGSSSTPALSAEDVENSVRELAGNLGMGEYWGMLGETARTSVDLFRLGNNTEPWRCAQGQEGLKALIMYRMLARCEQVASLLAAAALPDNHIPCVLYSLALEAASGAVTPQASEARQLIASLSTATFRDVIADPTLGAHLFERLFSRALGDLRSSLRGSTISKHSYTSGFGNSTVSVVSGPGESDAAAQLSSYLRSNAPLYFSEGRQLLNDALEDLFKALGGGVNAPPLPLAESQECVASSISKTCTALLALDAGSLVNAWPDLLRIKEGLETLGHYSGCTVLMLGVAVVAAGGTAAITRPVFSPGLSGGVGANWVSQPTPPSHAIRFSLSAAPISPIQVRYAAYEELWRTLASTSLALAPSLNPTRPLLASSPYQGPVWDLAQVRALLGSTGPAAYAHADVAHLHRLPSAAVDLAASKSSLKAPRVFTSSTTWESGRHTLRMDELESTPPVLFSDLIGPTLNSKDCEWHKYLYTQLFQSEQGRELLGYLETPFIEGFLMAKDADLWMAFLENRREFGKAARFRREFVDSQLLGGTLEKKIFHLEKAIDNARQSIFSASRLAPHRPTTGAGSAGSQEDSVPPSVVDTWVATLARFKIQLSLLNQLGGRVDEKILSSKALPDQEIENLAISHCAYKSLIELYGTFSPPSPLLPLWCVPLH